MTDEIGRKLVSSLDLNNSNAIDYSEFLAVLSMIQILKENKLIRQAFNMIDTDRNNMIDKEEIAKMFKKGETIVMTDEDIEELMLNSDIDKNGKIDYEEFLMLMTQQQQVKAKKTLQKHM